MFEQKWRKACVWAISSIVSEHWHGRLMTALHLQALEWDSNGELAPEDRLVLLNSLMPQCISDVQVELISLMERIPVSVEMPTACWDPADQSIKTWRPYGRFFVVLLLISVDTPDSELCLRLSV